MSVFNSFLDTNELNHFIKRNCQKALKNTIELYVVYSKLSLNPKPQIDWEYKVRKRYWITDLTKRKGVTLYHGKPDSKTLKISWEKELIILIKVLI